MTINSFKHEHHKKLDSTQDYLKSIWSLEHPLHLVSTDFQEKGKGRRGNSWSATDLGPAFSFVFPSSLTPGEVSLYIGVLARRFFQIFFSQGLQLKWPNDLIDQSTGLKCGGILGEVIGPELYLIGLGINSGEMTSKAGTENFKSSSLVLKEALKAPKEEMPLLFYKYALEHRSSPMAWKQEWFTNCSHEGLEVEIHESQHIYKGVFSGLDKWGGAKLRSSNGSESVHYTGTLRYAGL